MPFSVRILPRAESDAQAIFDWIAERSPEGAVRWLETYEAACESLKQHAPIHGLAPVAGFTGGDICQMLFKTSRGRFYRVLYLLVGSEVRIVRVRGPGQPELTADELA